MTRFSRRAALAVGAGALLLPARTWAQRVGVIPPADIAKPGALPDLVIGSADAKVTIVEYASMTCSHCAAFHTRVFPALKAKYIDTGKVRFVFREFPLDTLAAAASMLARCSGDKALPLISTLFQSQEAWSSGGNIQVKLFGFAKQMGFTQDSFDKCVNDQALLAKIEAGRDRAETVFNVESTPTFFIEGRKIEGGASLAEFDAVLEPLLKG